MTYDDKIHLVGRVSTIVALIGMLAIPLATCLHYDVFPPLANFLSGFSQAVMIYLPIAAAEFIVFSPLLGKGPSYLSFITGNITNLKAPCIVIALDNAKVEPGSEEAEVIGTLAAAFSALTTIIVIFIGLLLVIPLTPILSSPVLKPAFDNILPALFGALGASFFMKQWKLAVTPLALSIIAAFLIGVVLKKDLNTIQGVLIPIIGVLSAASAAFYYKKGWLK